MEPPTLAKLSISVTKNQQISAIFQKIFIKYERNLDCKKDIKKPYGKVKAA